jgi:methylenetetrahydrofolate--tRNA-(uracil-5-)-methyltransferase
MRCADAHAVPAGAALAVDRERFAIAVTEAVAAHPRIALAREEVASIRRRRNHRHRTADVAGAVTGPAGALRSTASVFLRRHRADPHRRLDRPLDRLPASRYDKGGDDYLTRPFTRDEYYAFVDAVLAADKVPTRTSNAACISKAACRSRKSPSRTRYAGVRAHASGRLTDPRTGKRPFAVAQARQDDAAATLYNLVGFQTKMTYPAQRSVLRTIPGLGAAEFVRLGSLHRNTFINSPAVLRPTLQLRSSPTVFLAGQLVGVEGYVESAASGILAGLNAVRLIEGHSLLVPPPSTALGSLIAYITDQSRRDFQPMNANYGLFPPMESRARGRARRAELGARAAREAASWMDANGLSPLATI